MTLEELAKLDAMTSVYRARTILEAILRDDDALRTPFRVREALNLIKEACLIHEAKSQTQERVR